MLSNMLNASGQQASDVMGEYVPVERPSAPARRLPPALEGSREVVVAATSSGHPREGHGVPPFAGGGGGGRSSSGSGESPVAALGGALFAGLTSFWNGDGGASPPSSPGPAVGRPTSPTSPTGALRGVGTTFHPGLPLRQAEDLEVECHKLLMALQETLGLADCDLRSSKPDHWGSIMGKALQACHSKDSEIVALFAQIPPESAGRLRQLYRELHGNVRQLEATAKPYMKAPPPASSAISPDAFRAAPVSLWGPMRSGDALTLHSRLEELDGALEVWFSAQRRLGQRRVKFADGDSGPDFRAEQCAVDRASASFEDFRVNCAVSSPSVRGRSSELLLALQSSSKWADVAAVQALLRKRGSFLAEARLACGRSFLELYEDKARWPEAERLVAQWDEALERSLGPRGAEDWCRRAHAPSPRKTPRGGGQGDASAQGGTLRITRVRGRNLRRTDMWDQADPYVAFDYAGESKSTGVVRNEDSNPEWREEVSFNIASFQRDHVLKVVVSGFNRLGPEDPMGHVDVASSGGVDLLELFKYSTPSSGGLDSIQDGSVLRRSGMFALVGQGCGDRGASVELDMAFEPASFGGDPLVLQPELKDEALLLVGAVNSKIEAYKADMVRESLGFFVSSEDLCGVDFARQQHRPSDASLAACTDSVAQYNRSLDKLNAFALNHAAPGSFLSAAHCDKERFQELVRTLQDVELHAKGDPILRMAFAFQDELLPSVGEWSTDRRRRLRNQALQLREQLLPPAPSPSQPSSPSPAHSPLPHSPQSSAAAAVLSALSVEQPPHMLVEEGGVPLHVSAVVIAVLVGVLIYSFAVYALIWGANWPHRGQVMLAGSASALACLAAAYVCREQSVQVRVPSALKGLLQGLGLCDPKGPYKKLGEEEHVEVVCADEEQQRLQWLLHQQQRHRLDQQEHQEPQWSRGRVEAMRAKLAPRVLHNP